MPLKSGSSNATISKNIEELISAGHPENQAAAIAYKEAGKDAESKREIDSNGFLEIKDNPISKVGVFPYSGEQLGEGFEPGKIYQVYRPEEELSKEETIKSFRLLPWTDDHPTTMLGRSDEGLMPPEEKGIMGVIGEDVYFKDGYLKANIKILSERLANLIEQGKKELSIGYRCAYEIAKGVFQGKPYDAIQRDIRGNHVSLVDSGRSGSDVAVLDGLSFIKFTFDSKNKELAIMTEKPETNDESLSLEGLDEKITKLMDELQTMKASKDAEIEENKSTENQQEPIKKDVLKDEALEGKDEGEVEVEVEDEDKAKDEEKGDLKKEDGDLSKPKDKAMDSLFSAVKQLKSDIQSLKNNSVKYVLDGISKRDDLANKISMHVGTFDHSKMTSDEVVSYGIKKLGIKAEKGQEMAALNGFLQGAKVGYVLGTPMDSNNVKNSSIVDKYINGGV